MAGFGIAKRGLGLLGKKRKTLTISGSSTPKKRTVIIKKPSTTKLADTWQDRRIDAINRKIKKAHPYARQGLNEDYAQEVYDIYGSKAKTKKDYKAGKK
jgi:hypothetical protein|tara:strand:- start:362 stop:658 length:297 start_codon:yes stop_codon:yes gene_type:complete